MVLSTSTKAICRKILILSIWATRPNNRSRIDLDFAQGAINDGQSDAGVSRHGPGTVTTAANGHELRPVRGRMMSASPPIRKYHCIALK